MARVSPADKTAAPALVRLADVRKTYAVDPTRVEVLRGVDLQVDAGDLLAVTGPSGAGKSTLMNILELLDRATSGMHLLEGLDVLEMDDDRLSATRGARIGFVFQPFQLLPRLTALENVGLPLVYRRLGDVEIKRCCLAALAQLGMAERAPHRPGELSGGQQQRVAIAWALVWRAGRAAGRRAYRSAGSRHRPGDHAAVWPAERGAGLDGDRHHP